MAINFPNNPAVNDTFTAGGTNFTFTGVKWESGAVVELSSDATPTLGGDLNAGAKNINNVGVITATGFSGPLTGNVTGNATGLTGDPSIQVTNATVLGNLDVQGTTTTIDAAVTAVDSLAVDGSITALGNIGIGTDNPGYKLHVTGGAIDLNSSSTAFGDGVRVGKNIIGYSGQKLTISSQSNGIYLEGTSNSVIDLTSSGISFGNSSSGEIKFYPNTWTINNNPTITGSLNFASNIGIGTDNPFSLLSLHQSGGGFEINANSGSNNARLLSYDRSANAYREMTLQALSYGFETSGVEKLRITSGGDVSIADGNLVVASGHGIDFSATPNASGMTSEVLDHYEEGTFTPIASAGYTSPTYDIQTGYYTRTGNLLYVTGVLRLTGGTATGSGVQIGGMPFTSANPIGSGSVMVSVSGATNTASNQFIYGAISSNTTTIDLYHQTTTAIMTVAGSNLGNSVIIRFSGTWRV